MTGETHQQGGVLVSVIGFSLLQKHGLLFSDVNLGIQWLMLYPFVIYGSALPDLDHHWESCPDHGLPSLVINKTLHLGRRSCKKMEETMTAKERKGSAFYKFCSIFYAKHRSWQTHSDLFFFLLLGFLILLLNGKFTSLSAGDSLFLRIMLTGLTLGVMSHLVLDMMTTEGIHSLLFKAVNKLSKGTLKLPETLRLVPKWGMFSTDTKWESFVRGLLKIGTFISILYLFYQAVKGYLPYIISIGG